ncbi:MAG: ATP-binding cassette domain-containing protein [Christensenella sp.]
MNFMTEAEGIKCENLTFRYQETSKRAVVDGANIVIPKGRVTVITGPSGCGKSTLLYLMAGIYPQNAGIVNAGTLTVDGQEIGKLYPHERAGIVGMMFQNPDLQFCMDTVKNELVFCLENKGTPPAEMDSMIDAALLFAGVGELQNRLLSTLSGGEKQKVMLACVVLARPQWLLLDEPFANVDPDCARELIERLGSLYREYGVSIVAVDHKVEPWLPIADEIMLVGAGACEKLRGITPQNIQDYKEAFCEAGIIFPSQIYAKKEESMTPKEPILRLRGVSAGYGTKRVLDDLNVDFYKGKIHAIMGKSGSGKSTLFSVLCRICKYDGSILLEGDELKKLRKKAQAHRLGFVFQNPQDQFVAQSVYDEMAVSLKQRYEGEALDRKIKDYLQEIGLWRYRLLSPFMLSQGQQRRLAVAALLAYDCTVLVCDEPTYAQDLNALLSVMKLLCDRVKKAGLTLIFSTHDERLARDYADVRYVLRDGKTEEI